MASKSKFNIADSDSGVASGSGEESGAGADHGGHFEAQLSSGFRTDLMWQWNVVEAIGEWWDGTKWQPGQFDQKHQKWTAYYKDEWYMWE